MELLGLEPELVNFFAFKGGTALLCGGLIGIERQLMRKPAGLRVCILVVFTTAFLMALATDITSDEPAHARVLAGIVTGVGFLGAGVIFRGSGHVSGITTASLIWALAAIGCAIGLGYIGVAIAATLSIMMVLALIDFVEYLFPRLKKEHEVPIYAKSGPSSR